MSSFHIPALSDEILLSVKEVARRAGCSTVAIYQFVAAGKIKAVKIADRCLIAESEVERLIRDWPTKNRGVSARWAEYRSWKHGAARSHEVSP